MQICMICILSSSHYVIAQSKAFFFAFAFKIYLRHHTTQLRHSFVVHPLLRKILDPPRLIDVRGGCGVWTIIGVRGWVWGVGL